jgi:hypothetical protein
VKEDVRVWHPGQRWIWQPGGLGVFDPGINALSILTHIIPGIYRLSSADLSYPANCDTPIAAHLLLVAPQAVPTTLELDFLYEGPPAGTSSSKPTPADYTCPTEANTSTSTTTPYPHPTVPNTPASTLTLPTWYANDASMLISLPSNSSPTPS